MIPNGRSATGLFSATLPWLGLCVIAALDECALARWIDGDI
jgi:hypothetical protein